MLRTELYRRETNRAKGIRANLKLPVRKLQEQLAALDVERGTTWIAKARARIGLESGEVTVGG